MRIALDGCDGVGKSTVAEKLANKFGCNIVRLTYGGDRSIKSYAQLMTCENVVHDRTFISEMIYPKYFGKVSDIMMHRSALFSMLDELKINTFILTASPETIRARIESRGDEFIDNIGMLIQINDDYNYVAHSYNLKIIDTTNKTIDEIVEEIGGYIENVC